MDEFETLKSDSIEADVKLDRRVLNTSNLSSRKNLFINSNKEFFNLTMLSRKKAKKVRFFRNGDKFFGGVVFAVTPEKYRNFDSLVNDLTRALIPNVILPNGVRVIFTMDGKKIQEVNELEDGKSYVVSGNSEIFKKIDYYSTCVKKGTSLTGLSTLTNVNYKQSYQNVIQVKARIITLIRNGTRPRRIARLLLNKRNSPSVEHVFEAIAEVIKLDSGIVKKVYTLSGQHITQLEQFFDEEDIFIVYGLEKPNPDDFELDTEEAKCVQSFRKGSCSIKKSDGPVPKMPIRKNYNKSQNYSLSKTTVSDPINLPSSFIANFIVGRIIGDGNFAIVKHCLHR